jgi:hypothetical protein
MYCFSAGKIQWYCPLSKRCTSVVNRPGHSVRFARDMSALLPRSVMEALLIKEGLISDLDLC